MPDELVFDEEKVLKELSDLRARAESGEILSPDVLKEAISKARLLRRASKGGQKAVKATPKLLQGDLADLFKPKDPTS